MLKQILRPIFTRWEIYFAKKDKIQTLEGSPYGFIRYNVHPYQGKPLPLEDGSEIRQGDPVIELHISNLATVKGRIGSVELSSDLQLLPIIKEELALLGRQLASGELAPHAKAVFGITLFAPVLRRLGFSVRQMEDGKEKERLKKWMSFLRWLFAPSRVNTKSKSRHLRQPYEFWISREEFIKKYQQA